ncbi:MAG: sugar phosphate isomerase/epimerase [Planctomycetales bacterium]|nr:sugar phosphate isomerase/epimerase [Planctomycetales bacterium]
MKSCVTISLVEEARGGPFVFWDGVEDGCKRAAELGFDAIEIFPPAADAVNVDDIKPILDRHNLTLAAVGTGAGMVKHGLSLTNADGSHRAKAAEFVRSIIDCAGAFGASAIIGSMQGRHGGDVDKPTALQWLGDAVAELGSYAQQYNVPLIYEPLNRYETNLCNTMADGVQLLTNAGASNVVLLADLFHMNIEEANVAAAITDSGKHIGHVHFVDSNRQAAGAGHTDFGPIITALKSIGYDGYLCAEAFPLPDSQRAAQLTIDSFRKLVT